MWRPPSHDSHNLLSGDPLRFALSQRFSCEPSSGRWPATMPYDSHGVADLSDTPAARGTASVRPSVTKHFVSTSATKHADEGATSGLRSRAELQLELFALRHQLQVLNRSRPHRLLLVPVDRWLWAWLSRSWPAWRTALVIVKLETVIAWHRRGFRLFWRWKSRRRIGRPTVSADVRALIRTMSDANPLWGASEFT